MFEIVEGCLVNRPALSTALRSTFHAMDGNILDSLLSHGNESKPNVASSGSFVHASLEKGTLARAFASLWLAAISIDHTRSTSHDEAELALRLLSFLKQGASLKQCICHVSSSKGRNPFTLIEPDFAEPQPHSRSWRDDIRIFARGQSESQEYRLTKMISGICGDLEARCDDAEIPLRASEARASELQREKNDLTARNVELHQQIANLNVQLSATEADKMSVQKTLQTENDHLIERVQALDQALKDANQSARVHLEQFQSESRAKDLQLRTTIADKEMLLEEADFECRRLRHLQEQSCTEVELANEDVNTGEAGIYAEGV